MLNIFNRGNNTPKSEKLEDDDKKSGISRRSFLKAGSILAVPVLGALAIKDNTELKAKIFEEVSRYFGEMSMAERLMLAREEFERDYGIRLDLKSLHEMNKEAEEVNSKLARELEVVKRVASDVYERNLERDFDVHVVGDEYDRIIEEVVKKFFGKNTGLHVTGYDSLDLELYEKLELVDHLREIFTLYPREYIRRLGLKSVNSGKRPYDYNTAESVTGNAVENGFALNDYSQNKSMGRAIYLDFTFNNDYEPRLAVRQRIFNTMSHELSHVKDNMTTNDNYGAMLQVWRDTYLNLHMQDYVGVYWSDLDRDNYPRMTGFYNHYGASHPKEDRATISQALWTDGRNLSEMCKNDKILAAKVLAIKAEYAQLDSRLDEEYWRLLAEGKYEEVKHYVKYTVKKDPINY